MTPLFADLTSTAIVAFHDGHVAAQPATAPLGAIDDGWTWLAVNHRCNVALWDEEDQARRIDVGADAIVANKRAIDRYNQERNDAIEKMDEALLARIGSVAIARDAWHNSETAGAMIDRLSILALKIFHMRAQTVRVDVSAGHIESCTDKLRRLEAQRSDLMRCFDTLLSLAAEGRAFWRVYRQFKMYNAPELNPYLHARKP
ncbi:MAG TPA: DUF4254 domain-containing protein [Casimicrobiaceae bacterium]|jgi:prepilin-type processing-associated H-X9-DG protein